MRPTWKCSTAPSLTWPRTWVTSNQSRWRRVWLARSMPLRMACVDAVGRGADDLGDAVGAVGHGDLLGRTSARAELLPTVAAASHSPAYDSDRDRRATPSASPRPQSSAARRHRRAPEALPALDEHPHRCASSARSSSRCRLGCAGSLVAGALVLPYVAVVMANAAATRRRLRACAARRRRARARPGGRVRTPTTGASEFDHPSRVTESPTRARSPPSRLAVVPDGFPRGCPAPRHFRDGRAW